MANLEFHPDQIRSHHLDQPLSSMPKWIAEFVQYAQEAAERGEDVKVSSEREMLTTSQAAARLSLDKTTVWRMIKDGRIHAEKVGTHYRIPAAEVRRHDEQRMTTMAENLAAEIAADLYDD